MDKPHRLIKALAWYTVFYISISFGWHLRQDGIFDARSLVWLAVKIPVLLFAVMVIRRGD
ncbi:MAG: hypothetical protein HYZ52_05610 [Candidatus Omnitrophica bacterium]|nr:hypothetical protein [Candidatus Omnitrophota bacterium]